MDVGMEYRRYVMYAWEKPPEGVTTKAIHEQRSKGINRILRRFASEQTTIVEPIGIWQANGKVAKIIDEGRCLYIDHNHLSDVGVEIFYGSGFTRMFGATKSSRVE